MAVNCRKSMICIYCISSHSNCPLIFDEFANRSREGTRQKEAAKHDDVKDPDREEGGKAACILQSPSAPVPEAAAGEGPTAAMRQPPNSACTAARSPRSLRPTSSASLRRPPPSLPKDSTAATAAKETDRSTTPSPPPAPEEVSAAVAEGTGGPRALPLPPGSCEGGGSMMTQRSSELCHAMAAPGPSHTGVRRPFRATAPPEPTDRTSRCATTIRVAAPAAAGKVVETNRPEALHCRAGRHRPSSASSAAAVGSPPHGRAAARARTPASGGGESCIRAMGRRAERGSASPVPLGLSISTAHNAGPSSGCPGAR